MVYYPKGGSGGISKAFDDGNFGYTHLQTWPSSSTSGGYR